MSTPPTLCFSISNPTLLDSQSLKTESTEPLFLKSPQAKPHNPLQIASLRLLPLDSLKQTLEVPSSESIKLVPLNNLNENRRAIHQRLREELQKISALVKVNQDVQFLNRVEVFLQFPAPFITLQSHAHRRVICLRNIDEFHAASSQIADSGDDIVRSERNMLDASAAVEVDVFLDLGLLLAGRGLVDGHLDDVVGRCHHD